MTQDEIIDMARQAGFKMENSAAIQAAEIFANLVAAKEREACAKIVEESSLPDAYSEDCLPVIANDIRARGKQA